MVRWKLGWKALVGATALVAVGCASGPPPRELIDARAAYQELATSPEGRERPQEVAEARDALLEAEREYDRSKDSPRARTLAYVALRKAEAAEAHGSADLASRQRAQAQAALQEAQALQRQRIQSELEAARQQLAEAERERQQALQEQQRAAGMAESQAQEAERLRADALRRQEEAERLRAQAQQRQAEAQRLAQQNQELQQKAAQLEAERQARAQAEQQAAQKLEAERQARLEAERKATEALTRLDEASKDVKVREEARGTVLTISGSVLFASGATDLLPAARDRLSEVADVLKTTDNPILIEGHTDSQGPDEYNEELSQRRAERVREFFITRGVPPDRIAVRGLGEYRPVASNTSPEGRANNRRVEIVVQRGDRAVGGSGEQQPGMGGGGAQDTGGSGEQQSTPPSDSSGAQDTGGSGMQDSDVQEGTPPPSPQSGGQQGQSDTQPPR